MNDLISRQAAIDAVEKESRVDGAYGYMDTKSIVDLLNDLPSVQPGIIRCRDYKWSDLINRKSALKALRPIMRKSDYFYEMLKAIQDIPPAEPERKKGVWISTDDGWDGEYFVCSVCGCPWTLIEGSPEDNGMNFCPNCGADMRGEQNEAD